MDTADCPPIGIDLGTTNSLISAFMDGKPQILANSLNSLMTPSAVASDEGMLLVGQAAWDFGLGNPRKVATAFKRRMGTDGVISLGDAELTAPELSAFVLRKLKADAEVHLGTDICEAVVSVPAYFNQTQREATRTACRLAGIRPLALINEPTAAALAYGLQDRDGESQFLVFDLGGGTLDVTVLEHFDGVMEVKASAGDGHLGGEDFTAALLNLIFDKIGLAAEDASRETRTKLRYFAEQAKRKLSSDEGCRFDFELDDGEHTVLLTPEEFQSVAEPLLIRMRKPLQLCLFDADGRARDIDRVVLVGGSTRMPMVRRLVAQELRLFPEVLINPDHAVALGAAIHAGLMKEDRALDDVVMTDVSPFSVGIATSMKEEGARRISNLFEPIVERNTPLPASRVKRFFATHAKQRAVKIELYQGEAAHVEDNVRLGELEMPFGLQTDKDVVPWVDVRITQDISGLIEITASVESGGKPKSMTVETSDSHLDEEEMVRRLKALEHLKIHPKDVEANKAILNRLNRLYEMALGEDRDYLQRLLSHFEAELERQDPKAIEELRDEISDRLDAIDAFYVS